MSEIMTAFPNRLPRFGLRWNGPREFVPTPMDDGYWTPYHLAAAEIARLEARIVEAEAALSAWEQVWDALNEMGAQLGDINKPLAVTASWALMSIERDAAREQLDAVSEAISTNRYMDPPDGGSVTLAEQVRRMSAEAEALRLCQWALREPLDNWKGECERKALDASRAILAQLDREGLA